MPKLVARLLARAALWVRTQTSLKNTKWATKAKEWPTHSSPPKICNKYTIFIAVNDSVSCPHWCGSGFGPRLGRPTGSG